MENISSVTAIMFTAIGLSFIIFNKQLIRFDSKLKKKDFDTVEYNLVRTRFYVIAMLYLIGGILFYLMSNNPRYK